MFETERIVKFSSRRESPFHYSLIDMLFVLFTNLKCEVTWTFYAAQFKIAPSIFERLMVSVLQIFVEPLSERAFRSLKIILRCTPSLICTVYLQSSFQAVYYCCEIPSNKQTNRYSNLIEAVVQRQARTVRIQKRSICHFEWLMHTRM